MTEMLRPYSTELFGEIFPDLETWQEYCTEFGDLTGVVSTPYLKILYYLLSAKYTNNPICNLSISQFYLKIASIIYEFGPAWEKRLKLQKNIRELTEDELLTGFKQIYNEAYNPNSAPSTNTIDELTYINAQKVNKAKRSKIDAYMLQWEAIRSDVTEDFLRRFKDCFMKFLVVPLPVLYVEDDEEN